MKQTTLRFLFLVGIAAMVAGCKLAVIVVEGGKVISDRSGTCVTGSICLVEVNDTNFQDAFEPIPNTGWYFDSWNKGERLLCGGSIDPVCLLSFQGYEESDAVENMVASDEMFYLMPIFRRIQPDIVEVNGRIVRVEGKEWLQPIDFTGYSYSQVSQLCPDGECSGTLPGSTTNLSGYIWASSDDASLLFQSYRKAGRAILEDFENTTTDLNTDILYAMLSDRPHEDPEYDRIYIAFSFGSPPYDSARNPTGVDHFPIDPSTSGNGLFGAWFWRPID